MIHHATKNLYDPTLTHANTINDTIEAFKIKQKISTSIADGLKSIYPKTPQLRLPPKIRKPEHPGRPIVSSINSHSSKISEYVDYHLQPEVLKTKSYIKDTNDFLNHLDKIPATVSKNSYLVTLDVKSLYSNIPNDERHRNRENNFTKSWQQSHFCHSSIFMAHTHSQ